VRRALLPVGVLVAACLASLACRSSSPDVAPAAQAARPVIVDAASPAVPPTTTLEAPPPSLPAAERVVQVAASLSHSCAVFGEGEVRCWGSNFAGGVGADPSKGASMATLRDLPPIAEVGVGHGFSCARSVRGEVSCWGKNDLGELGDGGKVSRFRPAVVPGVRDAAQLAVGKTQACARTKNGLVLCWGTSFVGRGPATREALRAVKVTDGAVAIAVGGGHACALRAGGTVACWGENAMGQLGDGSREQGKVPRVVPELEGVVELGLGEDHACARMANGTVRCWGRNYEGAVTGAPGENVRSPQEVPGIRDAVGLAVGGLDACARTAAGGVVCWTHRVMRAPAVAALKGVRSVAIGEEHACAVLDGGALGCWGRDDWGSKLVRRREAPVIVPTRVPGLAGVTRIAAGSISTCARTTDGNVYCWGSAGDLGGESMPRHAPTRVLGVTGARDLVLGEQSAFAHTSEGAFVWGRDPPTHTPSLDEADEVALGREHECSRTGGAVHCFHPEQGPATARPIHDAAQIAAGYTFACARRRSGRVSCWGGNRGGELGDGTTKDRADVVDVAGITDATRLALGASFGCALRTSGQVWCWGSGGWGARAGEAPSPAPARIELPARAIDVAAGIYHACVRLETREVWCWGLNREGQLGRPVSDTGVPAAVPVLADAEELALGGDHTCARMKDGTARCWGTNAFGQLGLRANAEPPEWLPGPVDWAREAAP
jgi:alpha-tubulin suppressor-like RCC1 family protein